MEGKRLSSLDLAVMAGRCRQSPRTGFVHLFLGNRDATDTVPLYENFCFALALFRQKNMEAILEGKTLIERLLFFQTPEGNFPTYFHDFPNGWDPHLALKIAPILIHLLRDFGSVLPALCKEKIHAAYTKALQFSKARATSPLWQDRLAALQGEPLQCPPPTEGAEWLDWLISAQLLNQSGPYPVPYHETLQVFLGGHLAQERGEPQPLAVEYLLAEPQGIQGRLRCDHPQQIYGGILFPFLSSQKVDGYTASWIQSDGSRRLLWKGSSLHSLVIPPGTWEGDSVLFSMTEETEWILLFCNRSPETSLWIQQQKGLVFRLKEIISIQTPHAQVTLQFHLTEGEGDFIGHLSFGNRPDQVVRADAYDWQIGLRRLRGKGTCKVACGGYTETNS